jgi:sodium pump decarboxylase gamma subunit
MSALFEAGLIVTAIGMGVVFVLLTLLVGIIRGMSALCRRIEGTPAGAPAAGAAPRAQELVGVIGAAIAAYRKRHRRDRQQIEG